MTALPGSGADRLQAGEQLGRKVTGCWTLGSEEDRIAFRSPVKHSQKALEMQRPDADHPLPLRWCVPPPGDRERLGNLCRCPCGHDGVQPGCVRSARLRGRDLDAISDEPVAGAQVTIHGEDSDSLPSLATTDTARAFSLGGDPLMNFRSSAGALAFLFVLGRGHIVGIGGATLEAVLRSLSPSVPDAETGTMPPSFPPPEQFPTRSTLGRSCSLTFRSSAWRWHLRRAPTFPEPREDSWRSGERIRPRGCPGLSSALPGASRVDWVR